MSRTVDARMADVRRLLEAARSVYLGRARISADIVRATGLTAAGVELGFASLERDVDDADLRALVTAAGRANRVHVVLSANVFVAPLRAFALARAAADQVTIRPSSRDSALARALVEASKDAAIVMIQERDVALIDCDAIHVYGRDDTIASVSARARSGVIVRGHGAGLGVAIVTRTADVDAAATALAADVVPFDQRGCLSPRIAIVEGDDGCGRCFAHALHERLGDWGVRVARGALSNDERADAQRWQDEMAFVGRVWHGEHHMVALAPSGSPVAVPPAGRHVLVVPEPTLSTARARIAILAPFVVAVGTDNPARVAEIAPAHARISVLGRMQHPPLDGPVDRRSLERALG
ncbi:MAG: acyl-CoA reductase [Myxococcota bacterium]|nr:acyl-CoA reductase [Myxococcota bacterium]